MVQFTFNKTLDMPIEQAWKVLGNFGRSPGKGIRIAEIQPGDPTNNGVGAIRKVQVAVLNVKERLVASNGRDQFTYEVISGAPAKDYQGKVTLKSRGDQTEVTWSGELKPLIPLTGPVLVQVARYVINTILEATEATEATATVESEAA